MKNRPLHERLGFAAEGVRTGWLRERSFRTQSIAALAVFLLLVLVRPPAFWWALVAVVAAMVLALELLNSAVEGVIDLLHPGLHPEIKAIKDMIAGAVLIVSLAALVVAISLMVAIL